MNNGSFECFRAFIDRYGRLSDAEWDALSRLSRFVRLRPKEHFLTPRDDVRKIAFITKGLVRHYVIDGSGRERNVDFCSENEFTGFHDPFRDSAVDHAYWIQALENTDLLMCDAGDVARCFEAFPRLYEVMHKIIRPYYVRKCDRERELLTLDAISAYETFLAQFPGLAERLPLYHIAGYLGISPETLSRIRKKRTTSVSS